MTDPKAPSSTPSGLKLLKKSLQRPPDSPFLFGKPHPRTYRRKIPEVTDDGKPQDQNAVDPCPSPLIGDAASETNTGSNIQTPNVPGEKQMQEANTSDSDINELGFESLYNASPPRSYTGATSPAQSSENLQHQPSTSPPHVGFMIPLKVPSRPLSRSIFAATTGSVSKHASLPLKPAPLSPKSGALSPKSTLLSPKSTPLSPESTPLSPKSASLPPKHAPTGPRVHLPASLSTPAPSLRLPASTIPREPLAMRRSSPLSPIFPPSAPLFPPKAPRAQTPISSVTISGSTIPGEPLAMRRSSTLSPTFPSAPATSLFPAPSPATTRSGEHPALSSLRAQHALAKKAHVAAVLAEKERILSSERARKKEQRERERKDGYRHPVGEEEMREILQRLRTEPDWTAKRGTYEQKGEKWVGGREVEKGEESTAEKMLALSERAREEMERYDRQFVKLLAQKERELDEERRRVAMGGGNPGGEGRVDASASANSSGTGGNRATDPRLR